MGRPGVMPSATDTMAPPDSFIARFGVDPKHVHALAWAGVVLIAASAVGLSTGPVSHAVTFALLTDEQGPVEMLTFLCFAAASVLSVRLAREARRRQDARWVFIGYTAFALFCAFAAMEEISWGQSLLGFRGPHWLTDVNEQGETNLHNLPGIMDLNSAFVLAFGLTGLLATRLNASARFRCVAMPGALAPLFALITGMAAVETFSDVVFLGYRFEALIGTLTEIVEMLGAIGCLTFAWLNRRMLHREWRHGSSRGEASYNDATRIDRAAA